MESDVRFLAGIWSLEESLVRLDAGVCSYQNASRNGSRDSTEAPMRVQGVEI